LCFNVGGMTNYIFSTTALNCLEAGGIFEKTFSYFNPLITPEVSREWQRKVRKCGATPLPQQQTRDVGTSGESSSRESVEFSEWLYHLPNSPDMEVAATTSTSYPGASREKIQEWRAKVANNGEYGDRGDTFFINLPEWVGFAAFNTADGRFYGINHSVARQRNDLSVVRTTLETVGGCLLTEDGRERRETLANGGSCIGMEDAVRLMVDDRILSEDEAESVLKKMGEDCSCGYLCGI